MSGKPVVHGIEFAKIANRGTLRCDAKYRLYWGLTGDMLYPRSTVPCHPIRLAVVDHRPNKLKKGELDQEYELVELEDVEKRTGNIVSRTFISEVKSDKLIFGDADVLTTRLRPNLGKTILNDPSRPFVGTTEWIPIKVNRDRLAPILLKYFLLSPTYVDNAARLLSGKEHPRIAAADILSLQVPFFDRAVSGRLVESILKIETEIEHARSSIRSEQSVIDEIMCKTFRYPIAEHLERTRDRYYSASLASIAKGFSLRNSPKYHHPDFDLVLDFFSKVPHVRVKRFLSVPVRLGATAQRGDFIEEGEAFYVHPGATKFQGVIDPEVCYQVSGEFYEKTRRRAGLLPGDVLINRSGEAYGKVAFFDSEVPAVASDFTMRIRFDAKANPRFMWYFFRSIMFQSQIAREVRGASIPNIFPAQITQMFVVECSRTQQDEVAQQVGFSLEQLRQTRMKIDQKLQSIHRLIEEQAVAPILTARGRGNEKQEHR